MQYLIDGHNLIGKMSDIQLDDPDDEAKLILRLRSWAAIKRNRRVTIYFDRGLPGGLDKGMSTGKVKVIFSSQRHTADSLLISRIKRVKNPAEYTLVSSDQSIIRLAQGRRMLVIHSENFVDRINQEQIERKGQAALETGEETQLNRDEVEMWLKIFSSNSPDH